MNKYVKLMVNHIGFMSFLVLGLILMIASDASAVNITVNGAMAFNSGGFESETADTNPSYPMPVGTSYLINELGIPPTAPYSIVDVIDGTGGGTSAPGAKYGEQYLMLERTANVRAENTVALLTFAEPAVTGDVVVSEFSLYMDSAKTVFGDSWDLLAAFPLVVNTGTSTSPPQNQSWIGFAPQSEYWTTGAGSGTFDWTGAAADDMALVYNDGSYKNVLTDTGSLIFAKFDEWHDISLNWTVGEDFTVEIDGVTSGTLGVKAAYANDAVIGQCFYRVLV